jgi:hypothetical protein
MTRYILALVMFFISITPGHGKEYQSSFGFTVDIPEHWLVLTRQELKDNPALFDPDKLDEKKFGKVNKDLLKSVIGRIQSGGVEIYFNQESPDIHFSDNINVVKIIGRTPENDNQLHEVCDSLPEQLSSAFGRRIKVYQCKLKSLNNLDSLFLEFDGMVKGTRSIQYQIQMSSNVQIVVTATCKDTTLEIVRKEFEDIVGSIRFK